MKSKNIAFSLLAISLLGSGGYGLYRLGMHQGVQTQLSDSSAVMSASPQGANGMNMDKGKKVLYWHDPMVPSQKFDKPGKSPFMDMQLEPVYAEDGADEGKLSISSRVQQNLGIRTTMVVKGSLSSPLEAVGTVDYNDRDVALVQGRSNGFIEKLYVRAPLDPVRKGQALAELYVPDWVAAQEEYLSVQHMNLSADAGLAETLKNGALQRMRLAGMNDEQIHQVVSGGKVKARTTLTAPVGGVVTELMAREGMTVMAGAPLFRINGISTVWVNAEIPESLAAQVRPGNLIEAHTSSLPGTVFRGKVNALLPEINSTTRTLKARIEIANKDMQLIPGMFINVSFAPSVRNDMLLVPTEAVIQTGIRSVLIVASDDGKFAPTDVLLGKEGNGQTEVLKGVEAGQRVVVSGQFLVDSEASIKGTTTRMMDTPMTAAPMADTPMKSLDKSAVLLHHAEGKIEKISVDEIVISHQPIPTLQWPAMTMGFKPPASALPNNIAVGVSVDFDIRQNKAGDYEIVHINKKMTMDHPSSVMPEKSKGMKP